MAQYILTGTQASRQNLEYARSVSLSGSLPAGDLHINSVTARVYLSGNWGNTYHWKVTAGGYTGELEHRITEAEYASLPAYFDINIPIDQDFPVGTVDSMSVINDGSSGQSQVTYINAGTQYLIIDYTLITPCQPPTKVSVSTTNVAPSTSVTLSWSKAKAGGANAITGYIVWRADSVDGNYVNIAEISTSATSGSCSVTSPAANNTNYYYRIETLGTVDGYDSDVSDAFAILSTVYTAPSAPALTVPASVTPGSSISLSWTAAQNGTNNPVTGYQLQRRADNGSWTTLVSSQAGLTYTDTTATTPGVVYGYRVRARASLMNGSWSDVRTCTVVYVPSSPSIASAGTIYNPRPRILVTVSSGGSANNLYVSAPGYTPSRSSGIPSDGKVVLRRSSAMEVGSETVTVSNYDKFGQTATATASLTYAAPVWTDPALEAGSTLIKAAHINELRAAIEAIREYYGMNTVTWSEDVVAGRTPTAHWAAHIAELQAQIRAIADYINAWDASGSSGDIVLPAMETPTTPKLSVINTLRDCIALL